VDDPRWATFDCYGTLVDWNAGIRAELDRLFGSAVGGKLLVRYHAVEPRVQSEHPTWRYRDVMAAVLAELASEAGVTLPADERDALGRSLPEWPVFVEVPGALAEAHDRGWRLVALSNTDRDLIEASIKAIGSVGRFSCGPWCRAPAEAAKARAARRSSAAGRAWTSACGPRGLGSFDR